MIPALALAALLAAPAPAPLRSCIMLTPGNNAQYIGVDDRTIVIRSFSHAWKLTTTPSSLITDPQAYFINVVRGPSTLCGPLDFQLSVGLQQTPIQTPLIVQDFRPITVAEAKAMTERPRRR